MGYKMYLWNINKKQPPSRAKENTMQSILTPIIIAVIYAVCFGVEILIGKFIYDGLQSRKHRKNVLKAIKDLNIEDELARCPALDAKLYNAIKTYLWDHKMPDPFIGRGSALVMTIVIADLRKKGKIKSLEPVTKLDEPVKEDSSETPVAFSINAFHRWLAKWGFKKNLNMLQLMQYKLDEYQGDYSCLVKDLVDARPVVKEYLVTIHGEYVFVDANTLSKMEADFYAEKVSPNAHLFALPKDWVDDIVNKHPELILTDVE